MGWVPAKLTVDPVLLIEDAGDDTRTEASCWVKRAAGVVHTDKLSDK